MVTANFIANKLVLLLKILILLILKIMLLLILKNGLLKSRQMLKLLSLMKIIIQEVILRLTKISLLVTSDSFYSNNVLL